MRLQALLMQLTALLTLIFLRASASFLSVRRAPFHLGSTTQTTTTTTTITTLLTTNADADADASLEELRARPVRELKADLTTRGISTIGLLEKEELVQKIHDAQEQSASQSSSAPTPTEFSPPRNTAVLTTPLFWASYSSDIPVSAGNMPEGAQQEGTLRPTDQRYCAIRVHVHQGDGSESFSLSLLLDTACSGIVLRPSTIEKHKLPVVTSPVSMTSAGGTSTSNSQVATLESFSLEGTSNRRRFGPLPAALQDMGGLPQALDGIIGLSFLSQFDSVEFNFVDELVSLYDNDTPAPPDHWNKVAEGEMHMLGSLGIYAVDTWWGGRGPIRMLVDTGAATSYWSWSGVTKDLRIPRDSPTVQRLSHSMGAMGSDNKATPLTHRIYVSSVFGLPGGSGVDLSNGRIAVDIGDIPILQHLETLGVGGILGLDLIRRCSAVRVRCKGVKPYLQLYAVAPAS